MSGGGSDVGSYDLGDGEDLDDIALLDVDHAEDRVEQEIDLARQEGSVIGQGVDVAVDRLEARAYVLCRPFVVRRVLFDEGREPADADQALADLRGHTGRASGRERVCH